MLYSAYRNLTTEIQKENVMIQINVDAYNEMLGKISEELLSSVASCIGQCTGCMCSCRCSCSRGMISQFEWEMI